MKTEIDKKDQEYNAILTCSVVLSGERKWGFFWGGGGLIESGRY